MPAKWIAVFFLCLSSCLIGCRRDKPLKSYDEVTDEAGYVSHYDRVSSLMGLNCVTGHVYFDMQGRLVRIRKGSLTVSLDEHRYAAKCGLGVFALFKDGNTVWTLPIDAHHEVLLDEDSNILFLSKERTSFRKRQHVSIEVLYTVSQQGRILSKQSFKCLYEQLEKWLPISPDSIVCNNRKEGNRFTRHTAAYFDTTVFHINSVQVIPPNPLEKTDSAFAQGNLLVSDFLNNYFAIIGRKDFRIRWLYYQGQSCMGQHAVRMLPDGRIMFFVNNLYDSMGHLYSAVRIIDPVSKHILWEYSGSPPRTLHSLTQGYCQYLSNGNFLITVNNFEEGGQQYVQEVSPAKKIVWEWHPLVEKGSSFIDFYRVDRVALPEK